MKDNEEAKRDRWFTLRMQPRTAAVKDEQKKDFFLR